MKKTLVFIFIVTVLGCTVDDICTEPTTPNLVLRFYDAENTASLKSTDSLYVWAEEKDSVLINQITDSIAIPLNTASSSTVYYLAKGTLLQNKITISYTPENQYVSRPCGYKIVFNEVSISADTPANGWISSVTPTYLTTINQQTAAHVQVFH